MSRPRLTYQTGSLRYLYVVLTSRRSQGAQPDVLRAIQIAIQSLELMQASKAELTRHPAHPQTILNSTSINTCSQWILMATNKPTSGWNEKLCCPLRAAAPKITATGGVNKLPGSQYWLVRCATDRGCEQPTALYIHVSE